ncbi:MAG: hypothetical protein AAFX50_07895 [Acidobacteriota bacterium]
MFVRYTFFLLILTLLSAPAFAFGSAGADCNGDGVDDISCSGGVCGSMDEGALAGVGGYCKCNGPNGTDSKTCAEWKSIAPASFMLQDIPWLTLSTPGDGEAFGGDDLESIGDEPGGEAPAPVLPTRAIAKTV